ncbi:MAG: hypothetical protein RBS36_05375 [Thiomicrospira sp.]|jgi:hypothetical protein|nr:hypothetical protein [Thiomicrospira sp.]
MSFLKRLKDNVAVNRIEDEAFYELVLYEAENGPRRNGLWAKAIIEAGSHEKAEAVYLKLLAQAMKDEAYLSKRVAELSTHNTSSNQISKKVLNTPILEEKEVDISAGLTSEELIREILDKTFYRKNIHAKTLKEQAAIQIERFELEMELEELPISELRIRYRELN